MCVLDSVWRSMFQVKSGSGVSAFSLWSNPGPLNEEACTDCGGNYKSGLLDIWKGVSEVCTVLNMIETACATVSWFSVID